MNPNDLDDFIELAAGEQFIGDDDDDDDGDDFGAMLREIASGSEVIAGDYDFVGARRNRRRGGVAAMMNRASKLAKLKRMMAGAAAARVERQGVNTVRNYGDNARRTFAGGTLQVTAPGIQTLTIRLQEAQRPDRLLLRAIQSLAGPPAARVRVLPEEIQIADIKFGIGSQLSTISGIDASLLDPQFFANGADLGLDTVQAGTDVSFIFAVNTIVPPDANNPVTVNVSIQGRAMRR